MESLEYALIPIILGVCEVLKQLGLPNRWAPLASLALGVVAGVFFLPGSILEGVLQGLVLGLSASGLYSGPKNLIKRGKSQ
ncbi:hypothetical protein H1R82_13205 [Thermoactinomyces intermedius]|jgi:hypothetical protein|uniref:Holin n=1 Tax=Thermoactinomyces intermedius TaxID=2024 RepID=A0A8I1A890_THEIN|nr:hypothetical protein [Thermoactinomyces intermedius]MBA4550116.1 hypothetical protein [Thermoactinomyces intermedius]MBA4837586.1 hypothetical protein [Thermoactinomyces intermedius]MBH8596243.1 hypothetical protein [Thermoactinomyces intermedius]